MSLINANLMSNVIWSNTVQVAQFLFECGNPVEHDHVSDAVTNVKHEMLSWVLSKIDFNDQEASNFLNETLYLMDNEPCRIVASDPRVPQTVHDEAFQSACDMGHADKVQVLMHFISKPMLNEGMSLAADNEYWDIVELLLDEPGANPWSQGCLLFLKAIEQDEWTLARSLLEHPT
jgi:hypothetical protein